MNEKPDMSLGPLPPRCAGALVSPEGHDRITMIFDREMTLGEQVYMAKVMETAIAFVRQSAESDVKKESDQMLEELRLNLKKAKG